MSKCGPLWKHIQENGTDSFKLTYGEIEKITGLPIDHSFLTYKIELLDYLNSIHYEEGLLPPEK